MPEIFSRPFTRSELTRHVGDTSQLFGVELVTHEDGPERGLRVLRFRTGGGLELEVLVDRAMDVGAMSIFGVPLGWRSGNGFRHPWLHEHDAEGGLGWLRSFSGLVNTCGLDHIMGMAEEGADHFNYPYRAKVAHGIHGRVAFTPARLRGFGERWDGDACVLYAEGTVRQVTMFGENLELVRRIEAAVGDRTVKITDRVTNLGYRTTPHALLYHVNAGWPVVAAESRLSLPLERTVFHAHDPHATSIGPLEQAAPQVGFREQVYEHALRRRPDGMVPVLLANPGFGGLPGSRGIGLAMRYDGRSLPAFYQWQNLHEGDYVIGIEPATCHAGSREDWKKRNEMIWLEHGDSREYHLELEAVVGTAAIEAMVDEIDGLG
ncbi:MAG: aldose 1-epimerase family protein [Geminicoccaceae bacterium]